MRKFTATYSGLILGALYGLFLRLCFASQFTGIFSRADLFSVSFVWVSPIVIGLTPMLLASNDQLRSEKYRCFTPLFTVLIFFVFCFITKIEDLLCIFIIALPFMIGAMIGGFLFGMLILHFRKEKGIFYSALIIPILAASVEGHFATPSKTYTVKNQVIINNTPNSIWGNVVRVRKIGDNEFSKGFFNYAGIPRPMYAELDKDTIGGNRIGHFEGGLMFKETVTDWELNKKVAFDIKIIPASVRQTVFDRHVLQSDHFKFIGACYQLYKLNNRQTLLTLSSTYQLSTNINYYGSFWGNIMLSDFQQRLLDVIKKRCDK